MAICEICDSEDFNVIATEIREGPGIISQCNSCGLIIQDIAHAREEIMRYYNEEYQKTNSLQVGQELSPREHFDDRMKTLSKVVENIRPYLKPDMNVLEVGCGAGELLYLVKPFVENVTGIEMNKGFVDFMNNELGIEAYAEDISLIDFKERSFDVILSIMTLDHLPNPTETLRSMERLLTKDGVMYIEVPNREEALNFYLPEPNQKQFNKFFWHKAHYFYFTRDSLVKLLEKVGFVCKVACRHEYTLLNFLNWYFTGNPQKAFINAATGVRLFTGKSEFEISMNKMFNEMEIHFHEILTETFKGDTLCCTARR